jgi:3,4-dihydroxy 2-butanone 4-phosphate synthase / GTP cyclohydrolase II
MRGGEARSGGAETTVRTLSGWTVTRDPIERAITELAAGRPVVVVDDEDRENEGDLLFAATKATQALLGFTIRYTSGVVCVAMEGETLDRLALPPMTAVNEDRKQTAYTVSVDAKEGITTGISAGDRARTISLLVDPATRPVDLTRPGHVFPLRAVPGGVLERPGHTEAAVDLAKLAGLPPAGAICELVNDDGTMMRLPQLLEFAGLHRLAIVSIADLVAFRRDLDVTDVPTSRGIEAPPEASGPRPADARVVSLQRGGTTPLDPPAVPRPATAGDNRDAEMLNGVPNEPAARMTDDARRGGDSPRSRRVQRVARTRLPTAHGQFAAVGYQDAAGIEHIALVAGDLGDGTDVLVRVHSECLTGDVFGSRRCDCGPQLAAALEQVAALGRGVVLYMRGHEGRGIGLLPKLRAYSLQDRGRDTVDANLELGLPADARDYRVAAAILADLGVRTVRLLTNNPAKRAALEDHGVSVANQVPIEVAPTPDNLRYLQTKRDRMGHLLDVDGRSSGREATR